MLQGEVNPMATTSGVLHLPANKYLDGDGAALIGRQTCRFPVGTPAAELKPSITAAVDLVGGIGRAIETGSRVLVKPNFNSPDPTPASADVEFVAACIELLREAGAAVVAVGESSGVPWHPTRGVLDKTGLLARMAKLGVPVHVFDEEDWVEVDLAAHGARRLGRVRIPAVIGRYDRLVYLPSLKTHRLARFTMSLKLAVGLIHPAERDELHSGHLEEKVADMALAVRPDLIILDGRRAFVTRGPASGQLVEPGVIITGGNQVALDVEAVRILQGYRAENLLDLDAWELPQIKAAVELGLGPAGGKKGYRVIEGARL
jgi:uncharacterized protein (DUF362 family)